MKQVTINYYGVEGVGKNVTEAKREAGAIIERAMTGNYIPRYKIGWRHTIIIWRDPLYGWQATIIYPNGHSCDYWENAPTAEKAMYSIMPHVAQCAWNGENEAEIAEWLYEVDRRDQSYCELKTATGRAKCRVCAQQISKGSPEWVFPFSFTDGSYNSWTAVECHAHKSCLPSIQTGW